MLHLLIPSDFVYESASLRDKIQYWLHKRGWKHSHLALATGMQKAAISYLMSGERKFTIEQLDKVTNALELKKGDLYSEYTYECIDDKTGQYKLSKSKLFIQEVSMLNKNDILDDMMKRLLEQSQKNITVIFDAAEELYSQKNYNSALPLFKKTTLEVRNRQDYKLSLSYYRLFMIARKNMLQEGDGVKQCKDLMLVLTDYLELLPVEEKLEAYIEIVVFYNLIEDYVNTLKYANRLIELCSDLLTLIEKNKLNKNILTDYIAEAKLYKGFALKGLEKYDDSLTVINEYSTHNEKYKILAKGNECLVKILRGEWDHVHKYLNESVNEKKNTIILPVILEASIKHSTYDVLNNFLSSNEGILELIEQDNSSLGLKHKLINYQHLATYFINIGQVTSGIDYLLKAMKLANYFQNESRFKRSWLLFTNHFEYATQEQKETFNQIAENNL